MTNLTSLAGNSLEFFFTMRVVDLTLLGVPGHFPELLENSEPELDALLSSTLLESSSVAHESCPPDEIPLD